MRKPTIWVLTRSDTNRPVLSQKKARSLRLNGFKKKRDCTICVAKTKTQISWSAPLFAHMQNVFSHAAAHLSFMF